MIQLSKKIEVLGLGSGDIDQLPYGIYKKLLKTDQTVYLRTTEHPVVNVLRKEGIKFKSFDHVYESEKDFSQVYEQIVQTLLKEADEHTVIYAVPGHPMLAEQTVQLLLNQSDVKIELIGGQSYLDALFSALKIDPIDGFQFIDGTSFQRYDLNYRQHILFCQVYDQFIASEVKLMLLEDLPANYNIYVVDAAGTSGEKVIKLPLEELDRSFEMSNLTTVYVPPIKESYLNHTFTNLRQIIATLRGPDGCPWDQKQTHESLRPYAIEEVYELIDAIDREDDEGIVEELGDVLLQVMLHCQIGEDTGYFTIDDVIKSITEKMIHRHPHVFARENKEAMDKTWEQLKDDEKGESLEFVLDRVLDNLPTLQKSYEIQRVARKVGFNWDNIAGVWEKFHEEVDELKEAVKNKNKQEIEKELGDVFFVLTNLGLFYKINVDLALNQTNNKFIRRFSYVEAQLKQLGKSFSDVTLQEMDRYWDEAKRKE